jgi:hypothetical protein
MTFLTWTDKYFQCLSLLIACFNLIILFYRLYNLVDNNAYKLNKTGNQMNITEINSRQNLKYYGFVQIILIINKMKMKSII